MNLKIKADQLRMETEATSGGSILEQEILNLLLTCKSHQHNISLD